MNDCESVRIILQEIGYVLTDNGREYRAKPLYRDSDNDKVLRIWKNSGQWVDFKENISGSLEDLVKLTLKLKSIDEAKQWISGKGIDTSFREEDQPKPTIKQTSIFDKSLLIKLLRDNSYWNNRGISDSTLEPFQGGVATGGKMFNRYVFPIFNNKDDIIGFSGRDVSKTLMEVAYKTGETALAEKIKKQLRKDLNQQMDYYQSLGDKYMSTDELQKPDYGKTGTRE